MLYCACRERVPAPKDEVEDNDFEQRTSASVATTLHSPPGAGEGTENISGNEQNGLNKGNYTARSLLKSASISASKCVVIKDKRDTEVILLHFRTKLSLCFYLVTLLWLKVG